MITKTKQEIEKILETSSTNGLTNAQAQKRLQENGYNQLKEAEKESIFIQYCILLTH